MGSVKMTIALKSFVAGFCSSASEHTVFALPYGHLVTFLRMCYGKNLNLKKYLSACVGPINMDGNFVNIFLLEVKEWEFNLWFYLHCELDRLFLRI